MTLKEMKEQLKVLEWLYDDEVTITIELADTHTQHASECLTGGTPDEHGKVREVILWAR